MSASPSSPSSSNAKSFKDNLKSALQKLGLPPARLSPPLGSYRAVSQDGRLLFVSGQLPFVDGKLIVGRAGETHDIARSAQAAAACAAMIIAQLENHLSNLERIKRILRLDGLVCATAEFVDHPKVIDGASDLMQAVFGQAGIHSRTAIGVSSLPSGALVEISAIVAIASNENDL